MTRARILNAALMMLTLVVASACAGDATDVAASTDRISFEEFAAATYREPWEGGVWIVDGDTPIPSERHLYEHYLRVYGGSSLIVHQAGGADSAWNSHRKRNLTYCVSTNFGGRYEEMVDLMREAALAWEEVSDVTFIHLSEEDEACDAANPNVVFDVRQVSGQPYLARAFFPDFPRATRNVLVDTSSFGELWEGLTVLGILRHELGHALGFRHEHTRPEGACFEDNAWRALTEYDRSSVMHYPGGCGGDNWALEISTLDAEGAEALYGPPGAEAPAPLPGENHSASYEGALALGEQHRFGPFDAVGHSLFSARMEGTGLADLYVRFGAPPTLTEYDCRPYFASSNESCELDVPEGAEGVYVMIDGYHASTYTLQVAWRGAPLEESTGHLETFDHRPTQGPRYADRSFASVVEGVTWSYVHGRDEGDFGIDGAGVMLRRGAEPSSLSAVLLEGIDSLSMDLRKAFTANEERRLEVLIDGEVVDTFTHRFADGSDPIPVVYALEGLGFEGPVELTVRVPEEGGTVNRQIVIDNLRWASSAASPGPGDETTYRETFDHRNAAGHTYGDGSFAGVVEGVTWSYVHARTEGAFAIEDEGLMLRRGAEPSSLSATLPDGIGSFSVDVRKAFTGNAERRLELLVDGELVGTFEHTFLEGDDPTPVLFTVEHIDRAGPVELTLRVPPSAGSTNRQITIDNLEWTPFAL